MIGNPKQRILEIPNEGHIMQKMSVFEIADSEDHQNRENDNMEHFLGTLNCLSGSFHSFSRMFSFKMPEMNQPHDAAK